MYVRCKPHVPLLNLNRTHAPSEGDGRTIHDNIYIYIYIYIQTAQVLIGLEGASLNNVFFSAHTVLCNHNN